MRSAARSNILAILKQTNIRVTRAIYDEIEKKINLSLKSFLLNTGFNNLDFKFYYLEIVECSYSRYILLFGEFFRNRDYLHKMALDCCKTLFLIVCLVHKAYCKQCSGSRLPNVRQLHNKFNYMSYPPKTFK